MYANVVQITGGAFDLVLDFGFKPPEATSRNSPDFEIVARVAMSLAHAKSMLPILARVIADYEKQFGTIPAPGFDGMSKE
ncbi:MAG: DUF3467 domain-containing protein [Acidimicrobiia bacterium]